MSDIRQLYRHSRTMIERLLILRVFFSVIQLRPPLIEFEGINYILYDWHIIETHRTSLGTSMPKLHV